MKAEVALAKIIPLRMLVGVSKKRQWQLEAYSFTPTIWLALDECVWIPIVEGETWKTHSPRPLKWLHLERGTGEIGYVRGGRGTHAWDQQFTLRCTRVGGCVYMYDVFLSGGQTRTHLSV